MMKKSYLFLCVVALFTKQLSAQFVDDFEGYTAGAYLGPSSSQWTTWSGSEGGTEDVKIVTTKAYSGANSVYFASTSADGGPADVVLPFGAAHSTGQFEYEMMMYVESGKGAYFNFQGSQTIGSIFTMQCYLINDGKMFITDPDGQKLESTYPTNAWFKLSFAINLNTNQWEVSIDDVSKGTFQTKDNKIASIDIFPYNGSGFGGNNNAGFWIDDVAYTHTPYSLPALNGAVTLVALDNGLAGQSRNASGTVRNMGSMAITSFDLTLDYNGSQITESVSSVSLSSLSTYAFQFAQSVELAAGNNTATVTISNVNGSLSDDDALDDSKSVDVDPIVPAPGKRVAVEEGTGTWCGWCPRGAVYMGEMAEKYEDYFIGIAVHSGDPMAVTAYASGLGAYISGHPSALVDRGAEKDPSEMEADILTRLVIPPLATMENQAGFEPSTKTLTVSVNTSFVQNASGGWRLVGVLTEDGVTGTGSGYNQANYYAGGGSGEMGGFEAKPDPVPASQMVYDHVARAITPDFEGQANVFTSSIDSGNTFTTTFTFTIDDSWNMDNMHAIALLIDPNGKVDNAASLSLDSLDPCTLLLVVDSIDNAVDSVNGVIAVTATGASGNAVYSWAPNVANGDFASGLAPGNYSVTVTDTLGCNRTTAVTIGNISTGINDLNLNNLISVSPNPTNGLLGITINPDNNNLDVRLMDVNGKIVYREKINASVTIFKTTIDLSKHADGVYFLQLSTSSGTSTRKVIKN